eukprot:CAMPEP_0114270730 /NCGR_PEP_ID=MMETSP0058-20121206/27412_1 /TAXON_ID=36894 /ORGANISM="Pyramimonas parkeae, CCMP726" /LENGTH=53 /DNA_ID=CAMNT_0001389523 /DNA_START=434 /DNA_END=592 /DNA_ORIENTATION=+
MVAQLTLPQPRQRAHVWEGGGRHPREVGGVHGLHPEAGDVHAHALSLHCSRLV